MEGTGSQESMGVTPEAGSAETLEEKMRIEKPPPLGPGIDRPASTGFPAAIRKD